MSTQSQTQHTPGPWFWQMDGGLKNPTNGHVILSAGAFPRQAGKENGTKEDHLNAALIAATPELLEALKAQDKMQKAVFAYATGRGSYTDMVQACQEAADVARAAIARAEGR